MNILITGGTGFIGKYLAKDLMLKNHKIYLLTRSKSLSRTKKIFADIPNLLIVEGDISHQNVIKEDLLTETIINQCDAIINVAATYDLNVSADQAHQNNIEGTRNILLLAEKCKNLKFFHHISSYAVAGDNTGTIGEDFLGETTAFSDFYAESKMLSEKLVRQTDMNDVKKRIYRPGIVIGSSVDGYIEKIDGPYFLIRFIDDYKHILKKMAFVKKLPLSYSKHTTLPLVPVNILSKWICTAVESPSIHKEIRCYHLTGNSPIDIKKLTDRILKYYGISMGAIAIGKNKIFTKIFPMISIPTQLISYMNRNANYSTDHFQEDYPESKTFDLEKLIPTIIDGYISLKERRDKDE